MSPTTPAGATSASETATKGKVISATALAGMLRSRIERAAEHQSETISLGQYFADQLHRFLLEAGHGSEHDAGIWDVSADGSDPDCDRGPDWGLRARQAHLEALSRRAAGGKWFTATNGADGLARIDNGTEAMFPVRCEWFEAEFIEALVNAYRRGDLASQPPAVVPESVRRLSFAEIIQQRWDALVGPAQDAGSIGWKRHEFCREFAQAVSAAIEAATPNGEITPAAYAFAVETWGDVWVENEADSLRTFGALLADAPPSVRADEGGEAVQVQRVSLADCPVGLFLASSGALCLKSEYGDNEGRIDAYIVESGEFFWGGAKSIGEQRRVMVTPVPLEQIADALLSGPLAPILDKADSAESWEATQRFCEREWQAERGTMLERIKSAEARADRLSAEVEARDKRIAELSEAWTDENGTVWSPPTAWAYAKACAALHKHRAEVEALRDALKPFAVEAERYSPAENDDWVLLYDCARSPLRLRHLRAARTALARTAVKAETEGSEHG